MLKPIHCDKAIGIKAKGRKPGRPSGDKPEKKNLQRLYINERQSIREIAKILGCSKDKIYRAITEYGIETRGKSRRSKLMQYSHTELKKGVKSKGIRCYSRELGIDESTLRHHLKVRGKS